MMCKYIMTFHGAMAIFVKHSQAKIENDTPSLEEYPLEIRLLWIGGGGGGVRSL